MFLMCPRSPEPTHIKNLKNLTVPHKGEHLWTYIPHSWLCEFAKMQWGVSQVATHIDDVTLALTSANRQHLDGATLAKQQKYTRAKKGANT